MTIQERLAALAITISDLQARCTYLEGAVAQLSAENEQLKAPPAAEKKTAAKT